MTTTTRYWRILVPATLLLWILFKYYYPYADFFNDSYTYIQAAADRNAISYRPIGYSLFLRLVHSIARSDTFLVTAQFLLVQLSCWCLFIYLRKHAAPGARVQQVVAAFLMLDPLIYYISNYVSSDALFIALSLFWFTSLLELVRAPTWRMLLLQWALLLAIFYVRYAAMFYPLVVVICCLRLRRDLLFRLTALAGSATVVAAAMFVTRQITRQKTGAPVFSAFGGWQVANNVLHIYPWLPVDTAGLPSFETEALAGYVNRYFNEAGDKVGKELPGSTTAYLWERTSPLHRYLADYRRPGSRLRHAPDTMALSYFDAWNRVAPVYDRYSYFLMRRHPLAFGRYFLWPSAKSFFFSPLDVFAIYNEGRPNVDRVAIDWFGYTQSRPVVRSATIQGWICAPFPWVSLGLDLGFGAMLLLYWRRRELRSRYPVFTASLRVAAIYLAVNAGFNIFASPSVCRYQVLPLILLFIFTCYGLFFVIYVKQRRHA